MSNENLLGIKKQSKIADDASGISSEAKFLEEENSLTRESLKAKFAKMKDKLKKMDEIIEDLKSRLYASNAELDEFIGI